MTSILRAYGRALRSLAIPGLLRHFLWPMLASAGLWLAVGLLFWGRLARGLTMLLQAWSPVRHYVCHGGWGEKGLATSLHVALYFLSLPLVFLTAVLLLEVVALPFMLDKLASMEYAELERRRGGSQWGSIRRTLLAFAVAIAVGGLTLPLWTVPGLGALLSFALSAWLNYRSFSYDALMSHADAGELAALPARHRGRLLLLALGAGTLTLVPGVNLMAVPFSGLAFVHYLLHELELERNASVPEPPYGREEGCCRTVCS